MQFSSVMFLSFFTLLAVSAVVGNVLALDHELQDLVQLDSASPLHAVRAQRTHREESMKKRFCGRRLHAFVYATCGECETGSDVSLSMLCCAQQCDMFDIIAVCCPSSYAYK